MFRYCSIVRRTSSNGSDSDSDDARTMPEGSRPALSARSSMRRDIASKYSGGANECHTSAHFAAVGNPRFGPFAPIQIGGCGCCTGRGRICASWSDTWCPLYDTVSPLISRVTISSASSSRSKRAPTGGNVEAELAVLCVEPGGTEREVEPSVRRVVDRDRLRREQRRVPVGHAGDEQPEPDARGGRRRARRALSSLRSSCPDPRRTSAGSGRSPTRP